MISEKLQSVFIHNPCTAGSSIKNVLYQLTDDWKHNDWFYNIETLSKGCQRPWRDYFSFAFCRNPYSRVVSAFIHNIRGIMNDKDSHWVKYPYSHKVLCSWIDGTDLTKSFRDFIKGPDFNEVFSKGWPIHFKPQYYFLKSPRGEDRVDYIGRFEDLNSEECDFYKMMDIFGVYNYRLPHFHCNHVNHYEFYDAESMDRVFNKYRTDFELYDYDRSFL